MPQGRQLTLLPPPPLLTVIIHGCCKRENVVSFPLDVILSLGREGLHLGSSVIAIRLML